MYTPTCDHSLEPQTKKIRFEVTSPYHPSSVKKKLSYVTSLERLFYLVIYLLLLKLVYLQGMTSPFNWNCKCKNIANSIVCQFFIVTFLNYAFHVKCACFCVFLFEVFEKCLLNWCLTPSISAYWRSAQTNTRQYQMYDSVQRKAVKEVKQMSKLTRSALDGNPADGTLQQPNHNRCGFQSYCKARGSN